VCSSDLTLTRVALVPLSTRAPEPDEFAVRISPRVAAALRLNHAGTWAICSEYNSFTWPGSDLAMTPMGELSYGRLPMVLVERLRTEMRRAMRAGALKATSRDE